MAQNILPRKRHARQKVENLSDRYVLLDSLLFKINPTPGKEEALLAIPEVCVDKIIMLYHTSLFAGHQGMIKTYLIISDKFFVPNLKHYLRSYLKACHICQLARNDKPPLRQLQTRINVPIERNWMHQTHVLPISIEPFQMNQNLLQAPKTLKEYINQYQENRKSLNIKEKSIEDLTFNTFLSSYMVDVILFVTGILTVILTFIIMYMLCRQSKLTSVVANLALQCVKTVEAATIKEFSNCNLELIQLLIMLNLILTILIILAKLKKIRCFKVIYL